MLGKFKYLRRRRIRLWRKISKIKMTIQKLNIPEGQAYGADKMTNQNSKKMKGVMDKFNSARENFEKKEKKVRADLEEASRIWKKMSETLEKRKQNLKKKEVR